MPINNYEEIKSVITKGNRGFRAQSLNDDLTGYTGESFYYEDIINTSLTLNQTVTEINAGDNPRVRVFRGPVTLSGSIKFLGVAIKNLSKFLSVEYNDEYGLRVGENVKIKPITFGFLQQNVDDDSTNLIIVYNAIFETSFPATTTDDGATYVDFTVSVKATPLKYNTLSGEHKSVTYAIINNKANTKAWEENINSIQFPSEWVIKEIS